MVNIYLNRALQVLEAQVRSVTHPDCSYNPYPVFHYCDAIKGFLGMAAEAGYKGPVNIPELHFLVDKVLHSKSWWELVKNLKDALAYAKQ